MRYNGFTRIPHYLLDSPNGLTAAEKVVLFCVYRLTAGYGRQSYRIKYSQLKEMTGIAGISRIVNSLADKKMFELSEYKKGGSYIFTILACPPKVVPSVKLVFVQNERERGYDT